MQEMKLIGETLNCGIHKFSSEIPMEVDDYGLKASTIELNAR
jgi:hypothetical protein